MYLDSSTLSEVRFGDWLKFGGFVGRVVQEPEGWLSCGSLSLDYILANYKIVEWKKRESNAR